MPDILTPDQSVDLAAKIMQDEWERVGPELMKKPTEDEVKRAALIEALDKIDYENRQKEAAAAVEQAKAAAVREIEHLGIARAEALAEVERLDAEIARQTAIAFPPNEAPKKAKKE